MEIEQIKDKVWKLISSSFRQLLSDAGKGKLYAFESSLFGEMRSTPVVIKGEIQWVVQFIPAAEFEELFGGYITWHPTEEIAETIGVWGKRNVSRFRRILRERGAEFDVIDGEGYVQRPWVVTTHGYTRKRRRMLRRTQESQSKP